MNIPNIRIRAEHPYYVAAVVGWLFFGCSTWMVTGNANTGMFLGLLAGGVLVVYGLHKAKDFADDIEHPIAQIFPVSEFEVFGTIKDALTSNVDDKWWVSKNIDDAPDDDGNMKLKYACNFEEPHPPILGQAQPPTKVLIVLDVLVNRVSSQATVELHYSVVYKLNRFTADDVIQKTSNMIWTRLDKLAAKRAAGPAVNPNKSYEF